LNGAKLQHPQVGAATFKRAELQSKSKVEQGGLFEGSWEGS
jgi:hypothetical protein